MQYFYIVVYTIVGNDLTMCKNGKKDIKKLYLNAMTSEQWAMFEVEYI